MTLPCCYIASPARARVRVQVIDMCNALDIEPIVTLAYDLNDPEDWADLVEYWYVRRS